jgi:hypothetical protein
MDPFYVCYGAGMASVRNFCLLVSDPVSRWLLPKRLGRHRYWINLMVMGEQRRFFDNGIT